MTYSTKGMDGEELEKSYSLAELDKIGISIKGKTPTGYDDFIVFGDTGIESYKLTLDGVKYIYANNTKYELKENEDLEYSIEGEVETIEENDTIVYKVGDWKYIVLDTGKIQLIEYTGHDTVLVVPGKINDYEVYAVGVPNVDISKIEEEHKVYTILGTFNTLDDISGLINFNDTITTIILSKGIEKIDNCAFEGLYALERVILPQTITYLGDLSISYGGLKSITIPENITYLGRNAVGFNTKLKEVYYNAINSESNYYDMEVNLIYSIFYNAPVEKVIIGEKVETLPHYLFYNYFGTLNFEEIIIPENIKSIGKSVFYKCDKLKKVYYNIVSLDTYNYIDSNKFYAVFKETNVNEIILGNKVKKIPEYFFYGTKINNILIPNNVEVLEKGCFAKAESLKEITIGNNLKQLGKKVFYGTGLTTVNYKGTKEEFDKIIIDDENTLFTEATINYIK